MVISRSPISLKSMFFIVMKVFVPAFKVRVVPLFTKTLSSFIFPSKIACAPSSTTVSTYSKVPLIVLTFGCGCFPEERNPPPPPPIAINKGNAKIKVINLESFFNILFISLCFFSFVNLFNVSISRCIVDISLLSCISPATFWET